MFKHNRFAAASDAANSPFMGNYNAWDQNGFQVGDGVSLR